MRFRLLDLVSVVPLFAGVSVSCVSVSCVPMPTRESWDLSTRDLGDADSIRLTWEKNMLGVHRSDLPGGKVDIWYLEAYCRSGSTDRDWHETVIRHETELVEATDRRIRLRCRLPVDRDRGASPFVTVEHEITASGDEVAFWARAKNDGQEYLDVQWVQPCMRVGNFTGRSQTDYQERSFIFKADGLAMLTDIPRTLEARYVPGQVFVPEGIARDDVNPRPISEVLPSNGLIGCFSDDGKQLLAMAWQPYQELFQGVIVCLHSDFRLGGIGPGEVKEARGKVYLLRSGAWDLEDEHPETPTTREAIRNALVEDLLTRYRSDFVQR